MNSYGLVVKKYSDEQLLATTELLNFKENKLKAQVIMHLIEIEDRELHLQQGYSSLFSYCREVLHLSESAAGRRIAAAKAIRKYPDLYELLVAQRLSLATLSLVSSRLTPENKNELITNIIDKSKRAVECYLASTNVKQAKIPERIKPVTVNKPAPNTTTATENSCTNTQSEHTNTDNHENNEEETVDELRFELRFSIPNSLMKKFEESLQLLGGKYPTGATIEDAFEEFVELFLNKHSPKRREEKKQANKKTKSGAKATAAAGVENEPAVEAESPTADEGIATAKPKKPSRYIKLETRDQVWLRDQARCTYVNNEKRCTSTHDLEVDHIEPFAVSKNNDVSNLRLRCRARNLYSAKKSFGKSAVESHFNPEQGNLAKLQCTPQLYSKSSDLLDCVIPAL